MFIAALLVKSENQKQPKCLSKGKWINEFCYIHAVRLPDNKKEIIATIWMNFKIITFSERSHAKRFLTI